MQYALQVFEYEDRRPFRMIDRDGEPWFVLADVCAVLGHGNPSLAARSLDADEKHTLSNLKGIAGPQVQSLIVISESGLYSLILSSRKEGAKRFKKWVTSEVLPSIRKTGSYRLGGVPAFIRRYNENWDRVELGYFSVINELTVRLWGRLERLGHIMADRAANGTELRPDVSVGRRFSTWLKARHPTVADSYKLYMHKTPQIEIEARQYPNLMLPLYLEFVDEHWVPKCSEAYFKSRDPGALPYLPALLPAPKPATSQVLRPPPARFVARPRRGAGVAARPGPIHTSSARMGPGFF